VLLSRFIRPSFSAIALPLSSLVKLAFIASNNRKYSTGMVVYKTKNMQEYQKVKGHSFRFYALNGNSVIDFKEHSRKEEVCEFLKEIRSKNPTKNIILVLDNFRSHRANATADFAEEIGIELVYLPPYSPDLNPIEFIWKSIKKIISKEFIVDVNHMKDIIYRSFQKFSSKMSFAKGWSEKFLNNKLEMLGS
jgi:putative transposase